MQNKKNHVFFEETTENFAQKKIKHISKKYKQVKISERND